MAIGDLYTGDFSEPNPCVCAVYAWVQKPSTTDYGILPLDSPYSNNFTFQSSSVKGLIYGAAAGIVQSVRAPLPPIGIDADVRVIYLEGNFTLFGWTIPQLLTLSGYVTGRLSAGEQMVFRQDKFFDQPVVTFGLATHAGMPYGSAAEEAHYYVADMSGYLDHPDFNEEYHEGYAGYPFPSNTPMVLITYSLGFGDGAVKDLTARMVDPSLPGSQFRGETIYPPPCPPPPPPDIGGGYEQIAPGWVISGAAEYTIGRCAAPADEGGWYVNHGPAGTPDWKLRPVYGSHGRSGSPDWRRHPGYNRTSKPDWIRRS